ncbi:hypothetical protein [Methanolacinia petrolearia]|uniref:hypothetical protein n=1 Tax=Methanolacinia petrolearia TaxID=54120 RepID=UPI003BA9E9D8
MNFLQENGLLFEGAEYLLLVALPLVLEQDIMNCKGDIACKFVEESQFLLVFREPGRDRDDNDTEDHAEGVIPVIETAA